MKYHLAFAATALADLILVAQGAPFNPVVYAVPATSIRTIVVYETAFPVQVVPDAEVAPDLAPVNQDRMAAAAQLVPEADQDTTDYGIPPTTVTSDDGEGITDTSPVDADVDDRMPLPVIIVPTPTVSFEDPFASVEESPSNIGKKAPVNNITSVDVVVEGEPEQFGCWKRLAGRGFGDAASNCTAGHEKSGLLCYPKCSKEYFGIGPVCWSTKGGFLRSYGRGFGRPMICPEGQDGFAGMCYKQCQQNYTGLFAFCTQTCPAEYPVTCGNMCFKGQGDCNKMIVQISTTIMNFLQGLLKMGAGITQIGIDTQVGNPISMAKNSLWVAQNIGGDVQSWLGSLLNLPIGKLGLC